MERPVTAASHDRVLRIAAAIRASFRLKI